MGYIDYSLVWTYERVFIVAVALFEMLLESFLKKIPSQVFTPQDENIYGIQFSVLAQIGQTH